MSCKACKKHYRILTRDGYCAFCYQELKGHWPEEFQQSKKERDRLK